MTCTNFPKDNLVPNVTQHQVGNVTYLYKGGAPTAPLWEAITGPLAAKGVTVEGGGSVQDFIDAQFTTTTELATGKFQDGQYVRLADRAMELFLLQSGGTANGIDILNAGVGKTAVSESFGTNSISLLAAGVKAGLMLSASAVENSNIIEYCLRNYDDVYWESGAIWINRASKLNRQHQTLRGLNRDTCLLVPTADFISDTIGGATAKAAVWYQPAGAWNVNSGFVYGGSIRGLRIDCGVAGAAGNTVEGIRTNRVVTMLDIKDVFIWRPSIGVNATYANWGATLSNVTVIGAYEKSIYLGFASNGVIMTGCNLFGQDWVVPTHLHVETSSYGVEYNGGVIEGAQYGAFIRDRAQVKFTGVDFEVANTEFIHIEGSYTTVLESEGGTLTVVGPPSSADTCTFVGRPSVAAIHTLDSQLTVSNSKFIPAEATGGVPCLLADRTGAKKGLVNQGILDINNDYSEWTLGTGGQVDTVFGERRGTWIPNISINGSSAGITYDVVNGTLLQVGKRITAKFHIKLSNKGVNGGIIRVTGLTSLNRIGTDGGVVAYTGGLSAAIDIGMYGESGSTNIVLSKTAVGGTTQLVESDITNSFEIIGTYDYWIE